MLVRWLGKIGKGSAWSFGAGSDGEGAAADVGDTVYEFSEVKSLRKREVERQGILACCDDSLGQVTHLEVIYAHSDLYMVANLI